LRQRRISLLFLLTSTVPIHSWAQAVDRSSAPALTDSAHLEQVPRVRGMASILRGFDGGLTFAAVHDSSIGWYNLLTPAISYTFSPHYSVDASLSIYPYRLTQNSNPTPPPGQRLVPTHFDLSDTLLAFHASYSPKSMQNTLTASMTAPSGNRNDGLGVGSVTFDLRDHVERYVGQTGFIVDLGGGDSSGLFNRLVSTDYSSVGPIAHFQAGLIQWLPGHNYIQSTAYEQLPIGDQKIYASVSAPGKPTQTVVVGRRVIEDNGFTMIVGIPLTPNITLSAYYDRSLRLHLDTVSVGITYVFRGNPRLERMSMIDRAIRVAEGATP